MSSARLARGELTMPGLIRELKRNSGGGASRWSRREATPPQRPNPWEEKASQWLFFALAPTLPRLEPPQLPAALAPFELETVRRRDGGKLSATFYPVPGERIDSARGAVLLLHPWLKWGRAYFHRYGRIEALRDAGYHALTVDFPGFGASDPVRGVYFDRAVEDALAHLEARCPDLPVHVWGVSSGGYWVHPVLSRRNGLSGRNGDSCRDGVAGAFFEDVSPHLLEWSWRMAPLGRPFYATFRLLFRHGYRYLDLRGHAPHLRARRLAYVSGTLDRGVRPQDTGALAERAGAPALLVPKADHLDSIKRAPETVVDLALRTFASAEAMLD